MTLAQAGRRLESNAERHLKAPEEMARLFADAPEAIEEIPRFLARANFHLRELSYEYPDEPTPQGWTSQAWLEESDWPRSAARYPQGAPPKVRALIAEELALIEKLDYAPYFLTVHDIVDFAREQGHSVPGARLGGQFGGLLRARHHRRRSGGKRSAVRPLHLRRAQGAARHRCRFRA